MGVISRLVDWIDRRIDRPADQSVLTARHNEGSESMIEAESSEDAASAGRRVRRRRDASRRRWGRGA